MKKVLLAAATLVCCLASCTEKKVPHSDTEAVALFLSGDTSLRGIVHKIAYNMLFQHKTDGGRYDSPPVYTIKNVDSALNLLAQTDGCPRTAGLVLVMADDKLCFFAGTYFILDSSNHNPVVEYIRSLKIANCLTLNWEYFLSRKTAEIITCDRMAGTADAIGLIQMLLPGQSGRPWMDSTLEQPAVDMDFVSYIIKHGPRNLLEDPKCAELWKFLPIQKRDRLLKKLPLDDATKKLAE